MQTPNEVQILLRMRASRLVGEPELFGSRKEAERAFEEWTGISWEDFQSLTEDEAGDPDELLDGPFAGSRLLSVSIDPALLRRQAA